MSYAQASLFYHPETGAVFSPDRLYRYESWRIWDSCWPPMLFLMLSLSTADDLTHNPTA
jgi:hypothetical protein